MMFFNVKYSSANSNYSCQMNVKSKKYIISLCEEVTRRFKLIKMIQRPTGLQNLQIYFNVWFVFRLELIKHWSIYQNHFASHVAVASSLSLYSS